MFDKGKKQSSTLSCDSFYSLFLVTKQLIKHDV